MCYRNVYFFQKMSYFIYKDFIIRFYVEDRKKNPGNRSIAYPLKFSALHLQSSLNYIYIALRDMDIQVDIGIDFRVRLMATCFLVLTLFTGIWESPQEFSLSFNFVDTPAILLSRFISDDSQFLSRWLHLQFQCGMHMLPFQRAVHMDFYILGMNPNS